MSRDLQNLEQLVDHIAGLAKQEDEVSLGLVVDSVGSRSFGPLLLVVGLMLASPLSGIPTMSVFAAAFVLLIALQMLIGRRHFWLPDWLLRRSINRDRVLKAMHWSRPPARFVDRLTKPRFSTMVGRGGSYAIAALCVCLGLMLPVLELVPFSSSAVGVALAAMGLALVSRDGLLVLIGLGWIGSTVGLVLFNMQ
jgi:hypothetical protein